MLWGNFELQEVISGLRNDVSVKNINISKHSEAFEFCEVILKAFETDKKFVDSISCHFASSNNYTLFKYNQGPYESLKSRGFEVI